MCHHQNQLEDIYHEFYKNLYLRHLHDTNTILPQDKVLLKIQFRITLVI